MSSSLVGSSSSNLSIIRFITYIMLKISSWEEKIKVHQWKITHLGFVEDVIITGGLLLFLLLTTGPTIVVDLLGILREANNCVKDFFIGNWILIMDRIRRDKVKNFILIKTNIICLILLNLDLVCLSQKEARNGHLLDAGVLDTSSPRHCALLPPNGERPLCVTILLRGSF